MRLLLLTLMAIAAGCADTPQRPDPTYDRISQELERAVQERAGRVTTEAVSDALLPPLIVQMPQGLAAAPEARFDLSVSNAPASQVFLAMVSGTRYSMIVHPEVKDLISVNLKDVTVIEALDTLRDLYGYEYRIQGSRISVLPVSLQSRLFQVNYLQVTREGRSDVRVSSGSITSSASQPGAAPGAAGSLPAGQTVRPQDSTRVSTTSESNFWGDITKSLNAIVGTGGGRSVIVNTQSGVIVARAFPSELRNVEAFLKAMQLVVERQVVLEAKIIEVTLREGQETGINWAAFRDGSNRAAAGFVTPGATIGTTGVLNTPRLGATLGAAGSLAAVAGGPGAIFGLALQTTNFAALLTFLESQGSVNVLSSPRIATINNQKAVLKVGTDEFFVTNVSTTAVTSGAGTTTTPTITVQPFFSGIALDVTPQIDGENNIILHVHPSVSEVTERRKFIDLGNVGTFTLPLASSTVNETDTIVRVQDSNIVAIGGLMRQTTVQDRSRVPGAADLEGVGGLFRQRSSSTVKSELVILIKPTIIHSDRNWQQDLSETRDRVRSMERPQLPAGPR